MAELVGITDIKGIYAEGEDFEGCLFENGSDGDPITEVDFLK
jgi:hypothetical protein